MEKEKLTTFDQMKRVATELYRHFSGGNPVEMQSLTLGELTYDGSSPVDMTEAVNNLVDDKLNTMTRAEEVAF